MACHPLFSLSPNANQPLWFRSSRTAPWKGRGGGSQCMGVCCFPIAYHDASATMLVLYTHHLIIPHNPVSLLLLSPFYRKGKSSSGNYVNLSMAYSSKAYTLSAIPSQPLMIYSPHLNIYMYTIWFCILFKLPQLFSYLCMCLISPTGPWAPLLPSHQRLPLYPLTELGTQSFGQNKLISLGSLEDRLLYSG